MSLPSRDLALSWCTSPCRTTTIDTGYNHSYGWCCRRSRLDYCNTMLYEMSQTNTNRLQRVQNVLAWVVLQAPWTASSVDICRDIHWLPVSHRVTFKLCLITITSHHPSSLSVSTNHPLPSVQSLTFFQHKSSGQTFRYH